MIRLTYKNLGAATGAGRVSYAVHREDGSVLLERCRDPLTDAARVLLAEKKDWPAGQEIGLFDVEGRMLIRADLRWAAKHSVVESSLTSPKFSRYVPFNPKGVFS